MGTLEGSPLHNIREAYRTCLNLADDDLPAVDMIVVILTTMMHPEFEDMVWAYLIGPPGGGKTELIRMFKDSKRCIFLSSPTENAMVSGYTTEDGEDPSLVKKLNGKVLMIKDLTVLMCRDMKKTMQFLGEMRDMYDGFTSKASGTTGLRHYESKFGFLAAVTPQVDVFNRDNQQLGERQLSIRMHRHTLNAKERCEYIAQVLETLPHKNKWRTELKVNVLKEIEEINKYSKTVPHLPTMTRDNKFDVIHLADTLSVFRTETLAGNATTPEVATRVAIQLASIAKARALADNRTSVNTDDINFLKRIVVDTLNPARKQIIKFFLEKAKLSSTIDYNINSISKACKGVSSGTIQDTLVQYTGTGILLKITQGNTVSYRLNPNAEKYLVLAGIEKELGIDED